MPFLVRGVNHLLHQSPGATELLRQHTGQIVRFATGLNQWDFQISDDGDLIESVTESPDAIVNISAGLAARLPFLGRDALRDADFRGDPALLSTLNNVFSNLTWDVEAELAPLIGDIAAHRATGVARNAFHTVHHAAHSLQGNVSEYVVEEIELMARKVDVSRFNDEVDDLVDKVARLETRINRLDASSL